jgi:6-phosphogluconolactonase (cycloisomerase 2 family)
LCRYDRNLSALFAGQQYAEPGHSRDKKVFSFSDLIIVFQEQRMLKKAAALLLVGTGLALCSSCGKTVSNYVYASIPASSQIVVYREDPNSGALTPLSESPVSAGPGVQSIAIHPSKEFLYAVNSSSSDISLFTIAASGALTEVPPRTPVTPGGTAPTLLVMDPAGSFLYVGNAESNNISVFSISSSSSGGALTAVGSPTSLGMTPLNMQLLPASSGNFLFVTGAGSPGHIEVWSISSAGALTLVQWIETGNDPQGLVIDSSGPYLYTANSLDDSIWAFSIDSSSGLLTQLGSPFGEAYTSPVALFIDNSGKYLYVANQGSGNLGAYSIGSDGGLILLSSSPFATNAQPSVIASDPSGKYLFVGNQKGGAIESFSLATSSGTLSEVGSYSVGNAPSSIVTLQ